MQDCAQCVVCVRRLYGSVAQQRSVIFKKETEIIFEEVSTQWAQAHCDTEVWATVRLLRPGQNRALKKLSRVNFHAFTKETSTTLHSKYSHLLFVSVCVTIYCRTHYLFKPNNDFLKMYISSTNVCIKAIDQCICLFLFADPQCPIVCCKSCLIASSLSFVGLYHCIMLTCMFIISVSNVAGSFSLVVCNIRFFGASKCHHLPHWQSCSSPVT